MTITLSEIASQFDKWNETIFKGELPKPSFELMQTKRMLGQFRWRKIGYNTTAYTIRISTFYDRPMASYIDTIVHEMLHYYIKYKGIKDTSSHGRVWKDMAAKISRKYNLTITRTNPAGGGVSDAVLEKKAESKVAKFEYVFLCKLKGLSHKYGASVCPSKNIHKFVPCFKRWTTIEDFKVVKAPWHQTYALRHMRTATSVGFITKEAYDELLNNKILSID